MNQVNPRLKCKALLTIMNLPREQAIERVANAAVEAYRKPYEAMRAAGISHELAITAILAQLKKNLSL
jgi:hypothetical protein